MATMLKPLAGMRRSAGAVGMMLPGSRSAASTSLSFSSSVASWTTSCCPSQPPANSCAPANSPRAAAFASFPKSWTATAKPSARIPSRQVAMAAGATLGLTKPSAASIPDVDFTFSSTSPLDFDGDLLLLGIFEDSIQRSTAAGGEFESFSSPDTANLDAALGGLLSELAGEPDFKGKAGQRSGVFRVAGQKFKRVSLVGLGKEGDAVGPSGAASWQSVGAAVGAAGREGGVKSVGLAVVGGEKEALGRIVGSVAKGVLLASFEDVRFKSDEKDKKKAADVAESVALIGFGEGEALERAVWESKRVAAGVVLTKQLVNAPPNVLTPSALADVAQSLADAHADVATVTILNQEQCAELGMGAYLAVAAASANEPKFIHLKYSPPGGNVKTRLAIIGKGLTFDSGGYNLKAGPGSMIEMMKFDMGGAGAVLGAAKSIMAVQPEGVEVNFIVAACENMISGTGLRPGDIITASNGKTIEVNNTDAEGRLTLADALIYASKLKVDKIVDLATLTGACIVALGPSIAGLFTPHDGLAEELTTAAKSAGEKVWRMPMEDSYWDQMKSSCADMVNTGGRYGGSITASLFLKQYVDESIPWAHLDIAGPVWDMGKKGATGYAASLLYTWVDSHATKS